MSLVVLKSLLQLFMSYICFTFLNFLKAGICWKKIYYSSLMSLYILRGVEQALCSGLSFQRYLCSEQLGKQKQYFYLEEKPGLFTVQYNKDNISEQKSNKLTVLYKICGFSKHSVSLLNNNMYVKALPCPFHITLWELWFREARATAVNNKLLSLVKVSCIFCQYP